MDKFRVLIALGFIGGAIYALYNDDDNKQDMIAEDRPEAIETASSKETPWSYKGETGPEFWSSLDPSFKMCEEGEMQSPINIQSEQVKKASTKNDLNINYNKETYVIKDTGYAITATPIDSENSIKLNKDTYILDHLHFHYPSEHQVNGKSYPMEIHFVHKNQNNELAVIGVFVKEGEKNKQITDLLSTVSEVDGEGDQTVRLDLNKWIPNDKTYYQYIGSLTTPPCTEGVIWNIFANSIEMSQEQISTFIELFPQNNRPIQPLHDRIILKKSLDKQ